MQVIMEPRDIMRKKIQKNKGKIAERNRLTGPGFLSEYPSRKNPRFPRAQKGMKRRGKIA